MKQNIFNFIGFDSEYEEAELVLMGIPYDGTVSYRPGTRFAPSAVRENSYGLETYSPYFDCDLSEHKLFDMGDIELPFGNTERVLEIIKKNAERVVLDNKILFSVGGEHLVTYPLVEAYYKKYRDELVILHFDAHTDLRDDYMGEKLSHASVIKRIYDMVGRDKIYQFCIRSGEKDEFSYHEKGIFQEKFKFTKLKEIIEKIKGRPVYVTIDLDVLDPSIFSGTGTPEAGGINFHEMLDLIKVLKNAKIVGADVVELSPHYDQSGVSTAVACKIIRELTFAILK